MNEFTSAMESIEQSVVLGNSVQRWIVAFLILVLGVLLSRMLKAILNRYGKQIAAVTDTELDDALVEATIAPLGALIIVGSVAVDIYILTLPPHTRLLLTDGVLLAGGLVLVTMFARWVDAFFRHGVRQWRDDKQPHIDVAVIDIGRKLTKITVAVVGVLAVLQTVGVNVMSVITGLGIGGLAVALAAQQTLANVLGSLQILTDRPFVAGDFIRVDGQFGRVQEIGLRSTKLMTPEGVRLIVPNKHIAEATIQNCSAYHGVTETFDIGLTYDTSADRVDEAADLIKDIIIAHKHAHHDVIVQFMSFGDCSLNLHVIYHHLTFTRIALTRSEINSAIKRAFDEQSLDFAFPTRTLHVINENAGPGLRADSASASVGVRPPSTQPPRRPAAVLTTPGGADKPLPPSTSE